MTYTNPRVRPEDSFTPGERYNLIRCNCGEYPTLKFVATQFDYDPRSLGWDMDTYVVCKCGKNYKLCGGPDRWKELWNEKYAMGLFAGEK